MIDENFPTNSNVEQYIKNAILKKGVDGLPIPNSRIEVLLWELCTQLSQSGGNQGPAGKSAYQLAVESGFEGTQEEWLNSLKGPAGKDGATGPQGPAGKTGATGPQGPAGKTGATGTQGPAGKSAYQLAVESGFEGTQEEWLNSLKGPAGKTGATGPQGPAGKNGTTPVKGVDYWTASDMEEIHAYIDAKIAEGLAPASKDE